MLEASRYSRILTSVYFILFQNIQMFEIWQMHIDFYDWLCTILKTIIFNQEAAHIRKRKCNMLIERSMWWQQYVNIQFLGSRYNISTRLNRFNLFLVKCVRISVYRFTLKSQVHDKLLYKTVQEIRDCHYRGIRTFLCSIEVRIRR